MKIGLHHGKGLVARAIQWQSRSHWNHASIWLDGWCYEAREFNGVIRQSAIARRVTASDEIAFFEVAGVEDLPVGQVIALREWLDSEVGCPYDYRNVFRFATRMMAADNEAWFCSELVFAALEQVGIPLLRGVPAHHVSPGMLALSPLLVEVD